MPEQKAHGKFFAALGQSAPGSAARGPVNSGVLLREKNQVLANAASLLGYQNYLVQARSWKAERKVVSPGFEREVQVQARQALDDTRSLNAAVLRTTQHLKQAGELDSMIDTWASAVQASGPVQVQELWSEVAQDPQLRQMLRDEGLTDELWSAISENMEKIEGQFFLQDGRLAGEVRLAGQEQARKVVLAHSATGMPRTVSELLRRGRFEQTVEEFTRTGALPLGFTMAASEVNEAEIADMILNGSVQSVQLLAQHKRKLEDTGLATYAGNEPATILIIMFFVGLLLFFFGLYLRRYCEDTEDRPENENYCTLGWVLGLLGLAILFGFSFYLGGPAGGVTFALHVRYTFSFFGF